MFNSFKKSLELKRYKDMGGTGEMKYPRWTKLVRENDLLNPERYSF